MALDRINAAAQPGSPRWLKRLAVLIVAVFVVLVMIAAYWFPVLGDEAFIASIAKNAVMGVGWASNQGVLKPFDPEITTGPGSLWALIAGIEIFGNRLWVPRVFAALLNLGLLAGILVMIDKHLETLQRYGLWILLILVFSRVRVEAWYSPLGDLPTALYMILAALFLYEGIESRRRSYLVVAGALCGAAALTKTMGWILIAGLWCMPLVYTVTGRRDHSAIIDGITRYGLLGIGCLLVTAPWLLHEHNVLAALPEVQQKAHAYEVQRNFLTMGSGVQALLQAHAEHSLMEHMYRRAIINWGRFSRELGGPLGPIPLFETYIVGLAISAMVLLLKARNAKARLLLVLVLPAFAHAVWLLLISDWLFTRHVYVGLYVGLFAIAVIIASRYRAALVIAAYLALLNSIALVYIGSSAQWPQLKIKKDIADIATVIEKEYPDVPAAGCGYYIAHEISYALKGQRSVVDCTELLGSVLAFDDKAFARQYLGEDSPLKTRNARLWAFIKDSKAMPGNHWVAPVRWTGQTGFLLVHYPYQFFPNPVKARVYDALLAECHEKVYGNDLYQLFRCDQAALERYIDSVGGLPQYPQAWLEEALM